MLHDKLEGLKKPQYETHQYSPWMSQGRGLIPLKVGGKIPKIRGTFLGIPILWTIVFWSLY